MQEIFVTGYMERRMERSVLGSVAEAIEAHAVALAAARGAAGGDHAVRLLPMVRGALDFKASSAGNGAGRIAMDRAQVVSG